ncbi:hypothetical protein QL285_095463 [Trifolium repens]|nr:hypothetical protein QL285_095463 [Trifolium repens]
MWQTKSPILCGKPKVQSYVELESPILSGKPKVQSYVANQRSNLMWNSKVQSYVAIKSRSYATIYQSSFAQVLISAAIYQSSCVKVLIPVEIYLSNFVWFLYRGNFSGSYAYVRFLHLWHLPDTYAYGNPSFELCLVLTPMTICLVLTPAKIHPALTHAAFYPLSGPRAYDILSLFWPPSQRLFPNLIISNDARVCFSLQVSNDARVCSLFLSKQNDARVCLSFPSKQRRPSLLIISI